MEEAIKKALIVLSIITGLLFVASLCYSLVTGYSSQTGNDQPTDLTISAAATDVITTETTIDETATTSIPTEAPDQTVSTVPSKGGISEGLTWNGLKVEVANVNYDAWPLIKAQNRNNTPPLDGMTMVLITARVTNLEGSSGEPIGLSASDFQLIGDRNTVYKTFQVSCGVVPDRLDGVVDLGDSFDGNVCFQLPKDESGFKLIYEPSGSPAVYFDLPTKEDNDKIPFENPPALVEAEELTWNGLKIDIVNANYNAWPLIKAQNHLNDPPVEGMTMLMVTIRITNVEGDQDEIIRLSDSDFQMIDSKGVVYKTFQISCGVIPDSLNSVVALGGSTEANICFQVPIDEHDFQLSYEPFDFPAVYFDLPESRISKIAFA